MATSQEVMRQEYAKWYDEHLRRMMEHAQREAESRLHTTPSVYGQVPSQRTLSEFHPDLTRLMENLRQRHLIFDPNNPMATLLHPNRRFTEARELIPTEKFGPEQAAQYLNPYRQNVLNEMENRAYRRLNERILPSLAGQFAARGTFGGTRHATLAQRAVRDLEDNLARQQGHLLSEEYGAAANRHAVDQERRARASHQHFQQGLGAHDVVRQEIALLQDLARAQQEHRQSELNEARSLFERQQNLPWEMLAKQSAILHGMPISSTQSVERTLPVTPQLNVAGQLGNLATNMLGASMAAPPPASAPNPLAQYPTHVRDSLGAMMNRPFSFGSVSWGGR